MCVEDEVKQAVNDFKKLLSEYELDDFFFKLVLLKVKAIQQPQIKMCFADLLAEEHQNEIELVHSQIQPFDFQDPKEFLQSLPSPSHEAIVLPSHLQIGDKLGFKTKTEVLAAEFDIEDATVPSDTEGLEKTLPHDAFVDPIADYMEDLFSSKSLKYFLYEDQVVQQWPLYVTILIMGAHDQTMFLISPTVSQRVSFFLQVLKWLHWLFHFT